MKRCPFCGSSDVSKSKGLNGDGSAWYYIECVPCAAMAQPDMWDKRPIEDELIEALEEVGEQLEVSLQRLGCCGHGDGKGRKADVDDFGGYESLTTARQAIEKARGK